MIGMSLSSCFPLLSSPPLPSLPLLLASLIANLVLLRFSSFRSIAHRVIIALGPKSSTITGFDIDTAHFTGNYGPEASVWGLSLPLEGKELEKEEAKLDGDDSRVSLAWLVRQRKVLMFT